MPGIASEGSRLHVEDIGDGPPVVLLHSLGFDSGLWTDVGLTSALRTANYRVIALDLRGHGRSFRPTESEQYHLELLGHDVSDVLDRLDLTRVSLVGYSFGARVALEVLQRDRRVATAVLGGIGADMLVPWPPGRVSPVLADGDEVAVASRMLPYLQSRFESGSTHAAAILALLDGDLSVGRDFAAVTARVLLLCGSHDVDPRPLADLLQDARVCLLDGADHASAMNHRDFIPAITRFLGEAAQP